MSRHAAFVSLIAFAIVFQLSCGVEVNVTDDKKLCLYANLTMNFSVTYEVAAGKNITVVFVLPDNVTTDGSKCGNTSSTLKLNFGDGHSWSVTFALTKETYKTDSLTFSYNLSDKTRFPNALSNGTVTVNVKPQVISVPVDTCYSCKSEEMIRAESVNMTLSNVLIQAFVVNGSKSEEITSCSADQTTTSAPPTTHSTNATTVAPITNSTTPAPPPTTPTPTLPPPNTGNYTIKTDNNTKVCLMANFGLRIGFIQEGKYQEMNFDTNHTEVSGSCQTNSSELLIKSSTMTIMFTFINDTKKFRLHALNLTANTSSGVEFSDANTNLSLWEAAIGSSYMCNKEQNYTISNQLTLYTFSLHVQPFGITNNEFSTAHECSLDDTSILIPIIVGAALAGLILIVVIAYVIGRRKTYVGYQTL